MNDSDKILLGTSWIRVKGKHYPTVGTIDSIGSRGPRLKVEGEVNRRNASYLRLVWAELGNQWQPNNGKAEEAYLKWAATTEPEDMVDTSLTAEPGKLKFYPSEKGEAKLAAIESETELTANSIAIPKGTNLDTNTVECHSVYHTGNKMVPIEQAKKTRAGNWWCDSCTEKRNKYEANRKAKQAHNKVVVRKIEPAPAPVVIEPKVETPEGTYYRWRVVVIQPTEQIVQAKDFLDAAAQVGHLGEVIRVEKL